MSSQNADIASKGIIDILEAVFADSVGAGTEPKAGIEEGECEKGVVTSPIARNLFLACSALSERMKRIADEHESLHRDNRDMVFEDSCKAYDEEMSALESRKDLLNDLMWQAIAEEHPVTIANSVGIREGWVLVSPGHDWQDAILDLADGGIACNFISRISEMINRQGQHVSEDGLEQVAAGEKVVGTLDDERIQRIMSLNIEIEKSRCDAIPEVLRNGSAESVTSSTFTLEEVMRFKMINDHFEGLSKIVSGLFWRGVKDTVPGVRGLPSIGIRRAWEVVERVPKSAEGIQHIMTPFGPAIVVNVGEVPAELAAILSRLS